jgi:GH35 family endo-1,4-beta-xylanase
MNRNQFFPLLGLFIVIAFAAVLGAVEPPPLPNPDVMPKEYWHLWNNDVQKAIDERIEKYRKSDAMVFLTDVQPGTEVKIEQISHEFLFGGQIFNFNQLGSKELDDKYKAVFGELLNSATIPFYWEAHEMDRGTVRYETCAEDNPDFWAKSPDPTKERFWRRPATDQIVEFCEQKGIFRHGHTLIYAGAETMPAWMKRTADDVPEMEKLFESRIRDVAQHYGDRVNRWDVVNESANEVLNPHHPNYDPKNPVGNFGVLPSDYTYKVFKFADQFFPKDALLSPNDYCMDSNFFNQIAHLRSRGCRIDVIGVQGHLTYPPENCVKVAKGEKLFHPEYFLNLMNEFHKHGLPLHLSETSVMPPTDDEAGREIQANIIRNLYRMWFSWPRMAGITYWDLVDGCCHPKVPQTSGLFTRQMEKKPAYYALDRLINYEWKTNIVQRADKEKVSIPFRGFKGKYKVSWTDNAGNAWTSEIAVK